MINRDVEFYQDIINRYSKKYSEPGFDWARDFEAKSLPALLNRIENKNLPKLLELVHDSMACSREIFFRATGLQEGHTEAQNTLIILQYCGDEKVEAYNKTKTEAKLTRENEQKMSELRSKKVTFEGRIIDYANFISLLVGRGYNKCEKSKVGVTYKYYLSNGTTGYSFNRKIDGWYIYQLLGISE